MATKTRRTKFRIIERRSGRVATEIDVPGHPRERERLVDGMTLKIDFEKFMLTEVDAETGEEVEDA